MAYNIKKVEESYAVLNGEKKAKKGPPFPQWKPALTEDGKTKIYNVRLLPYQDQNEQPFQEIAFYDNKTLSPWRLVAPAQFGLPDPIAALVTELRKQRNNKEAWPTIKGLLPHPRFFAPVLIREESEKLCQVWELSPTVCKSIYQILVSEDFRDEDISNPESGRDLQVTVSSSGKVFKAPNGKTYPVNDLSIVARTKTSKLGKSSDELKKILASIPDLKEIFIKQVSSAEDLSDALTVYLNAGTAADKPLADEDGLRGGNQLPVSSDELSDELIAKSIEEQFDAI